MKKLIGWVLIVASLLFLLSAFLVPQKGYVDFPCQSALAIRQKPEENAHIVWCISLWPRNVLGGGTIFSQGSTSKDYFFLEGLEELPPHRVEVVSGNLMVNNTLIQANQHYKKRYWQFTYNPWIIHMNTIEIAASSSSLPAATVTIEGDVYQHRLPNPLGMFLLVLGIWMVKKR